MLRGHFTRWSASLVATASSVVAYYKGGRRTKSGQRREETAPRGRGRLRNRLLWVPTLTHVLLVCVCVCDLDGTHRDNAVRLDLVDPEALLHHGAGSVEQLFQLAQSEWANLWETPERPDHTDPPGENSLVLAGVNKRRLGRPTRLVTWTMLDSLPRDGEGCLVVRTGSSMVTDTPDFCWLMERRTTLSLGVTVEGGGSRGVFREDKPEAAGWWRSVYLSRPLHPSGRRAAVLMPPHKRCSCSCPWTRCGGRLPRPSPSPPPPLFVHFRGSRLGRPDAAVGTRGGVKS